LILDTLSYTETTLDGSVSRSVSALEGDRALLTCVARNLGKHVVRWRAPGGEELSVNGKAVAGDPRYKVMHEDGGSVFVLSVSNLTAADSGLFICELNTKPPTRTFHKLQGNQANLS